MAKVAKYATWMVSYLSRGCNSNPSSAVPPPTAPSGRGGKITSSPGSGQCWGTLQLGRGTWNFDAANARGTALVPWREGRGIGSPAPTKTLTKSGDMDVGISLYELTATIRNVADRIDTYAEDHGGEIPADLEAELDALGESFEEKARRTCEWRANVIAEAEAFKKEAQRIQAKADALLRKADWIKSYLMRCMLATGTQKLQAGTFKLSVCKNSVPTVEVRCDVDDLPSEFTKIKVEADKTAIAKAWKESGSVPAGVQVIEGCHLRIS